MAIKVHVKNNRWAEGSFPNTKEGEEVFSITKDRFEEALAEIPELAGQVEAFIDWDTDHFAGSMRDADVLLGWNFPTENLRTTAPRLRWIHVIGAGVEHLYPMSWLPENVALTNNKGVHAAKAGEFGLMSVLMLHSHIPAIVTNQHARRFKSLYSTPITGKTLVVIGTGSLGGSVAKQVARLGVHVIGVNRHGQSVVGCASVVKTEELATVLPKADFVVVAVPETPETRGLLNRQRLELLRPSAGLVNMGRESAVDYTALCEMLENGRLAGAILDVFDPEPIVPESSFWDTRNLVVTPHVSADDGESYVPMTLNLFFRNLQRLMTGQPLLNMVRPELGY